MSDDTTPIPSTDGTSGRRSVEDPGWVFPSVGPEPDPVYSQSTDRDSSSYFYNPVSAPAAARPSPPGATFPNDDWLGLPPGGPHADARGADTIADGTSGAPRSRVGRFFAAAALVVAGVVGGAAVVNAVQGSGGASLAGGTGNGAGGLQGLGGQGQLGQQGPGSGGGQQGQQGLGSGGGQQGQQGFGPGGGGQQGQQGQQGFARGGVDGEQRLLGVVTAVGDGTITLRPASADDATGSGTGSSGATGATTTYAVTSDTEVGLDGAQATLTDFHPGDIVLAHVLPQQANGHPVLERLLGRSAAGLTAPNGGASGRPDGGPNAGPGGSDDAPGDTSGTVTTPGSTHI